MVTLSRLLGVTQFVFYVQHAGPRVQALLQVGLTFSYFLFYCSLLGRIRYVDPGAHLQPQWSSHHFFFFFLCAYLYESAITNSLPQ